MSSPRLPTRSWRVPCLTLLGSPMVAVPLSPVRPLPAAGVMASSTFVSGLPSARLVAQAMRSDESEKASSAMSVDWTQTSSSGLYLSGQRVGLITTTA